MSKLRNWLRKSGFDVVRYNENDKEVIPIVAEKERSEVETILKSVGRTERKSVFQPFSRPDSSTQELDNLENKWWNAYGDLIEQVWVLPDEVNDLLRGPYVKKAKDFFLADAPSAKILDLGCGSGWFGRMLADDRIEYLGTDFSSTQIKIANDKLKSIENKGTISYICSHDLAEIPDLSSYTGVVINAFLHHLYWDELTIIFDLLAKSLSSGCKVFILEPVYPPKSNEISDISSAMSSGVSKWFECMSEKIKASGEYDQETDQKLLRLFKESDELGYFLSPKEVPFDPIKFRSFLNNYVEIIDDYPTGVHDIAFAQLCAKIKGESKRKEFLAFFTAIRAIDKQLIDAPNGLDANTYLFTAFECKLK